LAGRKNGRAVGKGVSADLAPQRAAACSAAALIANACRSMSNHITWMGSAIEHMSRAELVKALKAAVLLLRSVSPNTFIRPEVEVTATPSGTLIARTFKWAFIAAGHIWSDDDRRSVQERLDALATRYGFKGAVVRFGPDRIEIEVPQRLEIEQLLALQEWLACEKDSLDISQVP